MKKILVLGIVGALIGAFIGWIVQTYEPIGSDSVAEVMLYFALAGAIAVNFTVWMVGNNKY